jgi:hypothetical protein
MRRSFSSSGGHKPHFSSSIRRRSKAHRSSSGHSNRPFSSNNVRPNQLFSRNVRPRLNSSAQRQNHFAESLERRPAIEPTGRNEISYQTFDVKRLIRVSIPNS